ncbi:uncharacterized protein LOC108702184 [Xenopus laevis]|uniref:Uncharacterized protein LOC108702184 n=1 Tax=Xenopus laevis TaxID=8355 RepID=A0A8J1M1X6_XENLA|nr:uncharacterized protein LOC108702184 [Xenopus laevis]
MFYVIYCSITETMIHMLSIKTFLGLVLISIVQPKTCKWLRPKQEYLNSQILKTFEEMSPFEDYDETCQYDELPNIDGIYSISQVEAAALAVREVLNETIRFYRKHHESMGCKQQAWERFQQLLYYQIHQLEGCIPETAANPVFNQTLSEQFAVLEKFIQEENTPCLRDIIQSEIRRNLQLAAQLSSRARRQHLLQGTA